MPQLNYPKENSFKNEHSKRNLNFKNEHQDDSNEEGPFSGSDIDYNDLDFEDSDEEPEFEETEEDRQFIADDDDDEDDEEEENENLNGRDASLKKKSPRDLPPLALARQVNLKLDQEKPRKKKKRKKRLDEVELDEEDLDLVEENTGLKFTSSKPFKRLKKGKRESHFSSSSNVSQPHDLAHLFDDDHDDEDDDEQVGKKEAWNRRRHLNTASGSISDEDLDDDADDFIVDDLESDEERGALDTFDQRGGYPSFSSSSSSSMASSSDKASFLQRHRQRLSEKNPPGMSREALDDIHQIFGEGVDYDWAIQLQLESDTKLSGTDRPVDTLGEPIEEEVKLTDVFEPSEVFDKMLTAEDDEMRVTDLPERFQQVKLKPMEPTELQECSQWCALAIAKARVGNASAKLTYMETDDPLVMTITHLLKFLRDECLEVPFILRHRKDYWDPMLTEEEVWKVWEETQVFRTFYEKRMALFAKFRPLNVEDPVFMDGFFSVSDMESIHDLNAYLIFQYGALLMEQMKKQKISPLTNQVPNVASLTTYKEFRTPSVTHFIDSFLLSHLNFMENYRASSTVHSPPTPSTSLTQELAKLSPPKVPPSRFLNGLKRYLATSLFHFPELKKVYREAYLENAKLSIQPTDQGKLRITPSHPYFPFKYLKQKPVADIEKDQFLYYHEAEKEGLVQLSFQLEDQVHFFQRFINAYATREGHEWNALRISIFKEADTLLTQYAEKILKEKLLKQSMQFVGQSCCDQLYAMANQAPYTSGRFKKEDPKQPEEVRVLGLGLFQLPSGPTEVYSALVHRHGKVEHVFRDVLSLSELPSILEKTQPDVVVIGIHTYPYMKQFIENVNKVVEAFPSIRVELMMDSIAKIYAVPDWVKQEFPDLKPPLWYCIGLARSLQEPLPVLASLFPKAILQLPLHPKQTSLSDEFRFHYLEKAMLRSVADMGVDLNHAYHCPYTSHTLQFVSGLGPRKATGILQKMAKLGVLVGRDALITNQFMGKIVFLNCASFLRINRTYVGYDQFDPLDNTRIHPEDYSLARKMAKDALDIDEADEEDEFLSKYVEELLEGHVDALDDLALDDYAKVIEQQTETKKRLTLDMIKSELKSPYSDPRPLFSGISMTDLFQLLVGDKLKIGSIVEVTITKLAEKFARCRILHSIDGIIWRRNFSDSKPSTNQPPLEVRQKKKGVVMELDSDRFCVQISLLSKDIQAAQTMEPPPKESLDPYFDVAKLEKELQELKVKTKLQTVLPPNLPLPTKHPLFRPFNVQQVRQYLKNKDTGEAIIRPSWDGENHFTISWVVIRDIIQHVEVSQDPITKKFKITTSSHSNSNFTSDSTNVPDSSSSSSESSEEYHDLDEILFRYVEACANQVAKVVSFRNYAAGTREELEHKLTRDIKAYPGAAAYLVCANPTFPGYFSILYMSQDGKLGEMGFKIIPKGFLYLGNEYSSVEHVVTAFKNGFNPVT